MTALGQSHLESVKTMVPEREAQGWEWLRLDGGVVSLGWGQKHSPPCEVLAAGHILYTLIICICVWSF